MTEHHCAEDEVRVLLLAPNWLGDAVMFSPLLTYLHENRVLSQGRKLVLDLAVRPAWAPLFAADPRLQGIISVDRQSRHRGWLGGFRLGQDFRQQRPAAVVLGPPSFRSGLAALVSGAGIRVGYGSDGRNFTLTHGLPVPQRGIRHHSQELLSLGPVLLGALGQEAPSLPETLPSPHLPALEPVEPATQDPSVPLWVLAPGATYGSAKSWPLLRALDFARQALDQHGARLVLLGDSSASAFAQALAEGLAREPEYKVTGGCGVVDLTGRTDLLQVVSILKACQIFVGNDSGLMHLAGALGVPTVGVFGSSNPDWTRPLGPRTAFVAPTGFDCRPCYRKSCNQDVFCLDTVSAQSVFQALYGLLDGPQPE